MNYPDSSSLFSEGDSASIFTLQLPAGASCPGDSAHDYFYQSFLIPAAVDPGELRYGNLRPDGDGLYSLRGADTAPYVQVLTGQNSGPGQPGIIPSIAPLSLAQFTSDMLQPVAIEWGSHAVSWVRRRRIGTSRSTSSPARVVSPAASHGASRPSSVGQSAPQSNSSVWLLAAVGVAAIGLVTVLLRRRSARPAPKFAKDPS